MHAHYFVQVTLGGENLKEEEKGDVMGSKNEEDGGESQMDDFDECDQDRMTGPQSLEG